MQTAIYMEELTAISGHSSVTNLKTDISETTDMLEIIDNFVADSEGHLQGDAWNEVQAKMSEFSTAFNARMTLADHLSTAIDQAIQLLTSYLEDYPYLDMGEYIKIDTAYKQCEQDIANIRAALAAKTKVETEEKDSEGNPKLVEVYVISDSQARADLNSRITEIEEAMVDIKKLLDKLDGLQEVYEEAKGILDAAFAEVSEFGISVSNIIPSEKVQYQPAS